MKVSWLFPGMALKVHEDVYIGGMGRSRHQDRVPAQEFLIFQRDMGWWSDFYPGKGEVLVYVGEKRSKHRSRLLREVLWRGKIYYVRPYDWRHIDILEPESEDQLYNVNSQAGV